MVEEVLTGLCLAEHLRSRPFQEASEDSTVEALVRLEIASASPEVGVREDEADQS
jgi:hypothetical protein